MGTAKTQEEQSCPAGLGSMWQSPKQRGETADLVLVPGFHSPGQANVASSPGKAGLGLAPSRPWSPQDTHTCLLRVSPCPSPEAPSLGSTLHGGT